MRAPLVRRAFAEALGTGLLVLAVVGSGIAAERLSPGDVGLQLLENAAATAAALVAIILAVGPVSGAHLNPAVRPWPTGSSAVSPPPRPAPWRSAPWKTRVWVPSVVVLPWAS